MGESQHVERVLRLPARQADLLARAAESQRTTEDEVVSRALDLFFELIAAGEEPRGAWTALSDTALARVWDNPEDARYESASALPTGHRSSC